MSRRSRRTHAPAANLPRAFDDAAFGPARTLNLRATLPTAAEATSRTEAWLRQQQMSRLGEVLVITGRGSSSDDGVPVLKPAVEKLLFSLRRRGVVASWREHTEGAFVVTVAPPTALFEAPRRRREPRTTDAAPAALAGLSPGTVSLLRAAAVRTLEGLGITSPAPAFVSDEMRRIFSEILRAIPDSADREEEMLAALRHLLAEFDA